MIPHSRTSTRHRAALGFKIWRVRDQASMAAAHTHADIEINFLQPGGRVAYLHAGVRRQIPGGRLAVLWGGVPHQTLRPGILGEGIWITFPLSWLLLWRLPAEFTSSLLAGSIALGGVATEDGALLSRWLADFESGDADRARAVVLELEARMLRLAASTPSTNRARAPAGGPASGGDHIERVIEHMARHYCEPLSIAAIAAAVRLHPNYLMRLFRRECHLSIRTHLIGLRIAHAQRLLVTTDRNILDVALESGFGSAAAFYECFCRHTNGQTPRIYRKTNRLRGL